MPFSTIQHRIILLVVSLGLFMEALDANIINTAIPAMAASLEVSPIDLKVALISYLLSLAIFIPISGWVADKFGMKRVFICAMLIFTFSSILCGFAQTLPQLVCARILQGLGGSLMIPIGRLILLINYEQHQYMENMNRVIMIASIGLMLGPVLGGFITHYLSWHWIFWVNIPVGLMDAWLAYYWLPASAPKKVSPLDKVGFVLFGGGLSGFTFALSAFSESTISPSYAIFLMLLSLSLLVAYFWHSRHQTHPIVKSSLFKLRTFKISITGNLLSRLGFGGVPFLLPLLLQIPLGYPPQISGLLLAPVALGVATTKSLSINFLRWLGFKKLLIINTCLVALALWVFATITDKTSVYFILASTFCFGVLISMQYSGMNSLAYAEVRKEDLSAATSIVSTVQQLSQSFGVASVAILITLVSHHTQETLVLVDFRNTFFILGCLTFVSILIFLRIKPHDGENMIKKTIKHEESEVIP